MLNYLALNQTFVEYSEGLNSDSIDEYLKKQEKKEIFTMKFFKGDRNNGDLVAFQGDGVSAIQIVMKNDENYLGPIEKRHISLIQRLNTVYNVIVKSVDKDARIVYVSSKDAAFMLRSNLIPKLNQALEKEPASTRTERVYMKAKVCSYLTKANVIMIDINDCGLFGIIKEQDWSMDKFDVNTVKPGMVIDVEVLYYMKEATRKGGKSMYRCSRRSVLSNNWVGISAKFSRGDIINVKCIGKTETAWYGNIPGLEGIRLICNYNINMKKVDIIIGQMYECSVYRVDEMKHKFIANPRKKFTEY